MADLSARYAYVLRMLFPRGRAWEGPRLSELIEGLAGTFARVHVAAATLTSSAPPDRFGDLTEDWLRVLGAEDFAFKPYPERYVASRLYATGGQSAEHYRSLIARLSTSAISFHEFRPMTAGMWCGLPVYGYPWRFVVEVTGINAAEVDLVKDVLTGISPAHVLFTFSARNGDI